jgi:hypothetical protein
MTGQIRGDVRIRRRAPYDRHAARFPSRPGAPVVSNLLLLVGCLVVGVLLRRSGRAPAQAHLALNAVILHVSLPAVTLRTLHAFSFDIAHLGRC